MGSRLGQDRSARTLSFLRRYAKLCKEHERQITSFKDSSGLIGVQVERVEHDDSTIKSILDTSEA